MGRIRSIHPGVWSDEQFAALSMPARVLVFGLWTDADDRGVFEWKPIGIKMRIFPGDSLDVAPLLDELAAANVVMRFEVEGKSYGAVRNFCRFQSPRRPSYRYPTTDVVDHYVALSDPIPANVGNASANGEGIGGGEGIGKGKEDPGAGAPQPPEPKPKPPTAYVFESGVIRLTEKDFDLWNRSFSALDVPGELVALSAWAEKELGPKRWFHGTANALAKKNREELARRKAAREPKEFRWRSGIEGVV